MNYLDWIVIAIYISFLIGLSFYLSRGQKSVEDYYLGGRTVPWWAIGVSTMATQLGAISFISAPAFVALKPGGGLKWIGFEFAVPLAMVFIMIVLIPVIHGTGAVSLYAYLERRFDSSTRVVVSSIFQISRALATGVGIYAIGIVLSAILNVPLTPTIIIIGFVTIIYDVLGGIKAVIYTDVIQMLVLTLGILITGLTAYFLIGGWENLLTGFEAERLQMLNLNSHGFGDGEDFSFWALVVGGFFLYVAYYGCDQSQIQREMSAKNLDEAKRSLMLNGIARVLIVAAYLTMGLLIGAYALQSETFLSLIPDGSYDYMVPTFVLNYLPHGVIGFIVVALIAAFMSSLDSAINSLSAATMRDIYQKFINADASESHNFMMSRVLTVFWGVICTGFAFLVGGISDTVIEAINKVGSLFYGPILAAFVLGIMFRATTANGVKLGVLCGVLVNFVLWIGFPEVSWLWWNAAGCLSAIFIGLIWSSILPGKKQVPHSLLYLPKADSKWKWRYLFLIVYFFFIIIVTYIIQTFWLT
ncbi:MAG: sodium:solute symporter [Thermodesulfobacteriota bacterium]